jgi:hypothetical protein
MVFAEDNAEAGSETTGESTNLSDKTDTIPFSTLFYQFGSNTLHSFTYNYGLNYVLAGYGTGYIFRVAEQPYNGSICHGNSSG